MEIIIRLTASLGIFFIMICWEFFNPRRPQRIKRNQRWPVNIGLGIFNMVIMRLTVGSFAYLIAVISANNSWGLLNWLAAPEWLSIFVTILFLDFAIYGQHIISHKWSPLWHLHQVHHTDLEFDATTAVRFHPLEIIISMIYKVICIYLIGANPLGVIAFEIILNGAATFNHSNVNISSVIDNKLRWLIVTPDMHRIHHSSIPVEIDSNYGFSLSCWDKLFKTYTAEPKLSQTNLTIGLEYYRQQSDLGFMSLLLLPFKKLRK
jgi:sterol desaturase/sphingolipid hydroxylase (fatty acid hydroxylase superfamily)